jgi:predicted transcriptional regulator
LSDQDELWHYGTPRHSGRYPWGSGEHHDGMHGTQRYKTFMDNVEKLRKQGLNEKEIAKGMGLESVSQLRNNKTVARNALLKENQKRAMELKDRGNSNIAIGKLMNLNESSVRALLNTSVREKAQELETTASKFKEAVDKGVFPQIGVGVENHLGIAGSKLKAAVSMLKDQGYEVINVQTDQIGTGKKSTIKVLAPPGTKYVDVVKNMDKIGLVGVYSEDGGKTFRDVQPPKSIDSSRVAVRYAEQGGSKKDGVIELRRGVDDISLGASSYAQVRVAVDGTHYLKGMAMYGENMPKGVDVIFNTNKSDTGSKLDAMKSMKGDPNTEELPFGSVVRQRFYKDANGKEHQSVLNIVGSKEGSGEEGGWHKWSDSLSSQMLSKQAPALIKKQLGLTLKSKQEEFDEIMKLTNPVIREKLLHSFADSADSSAVHLKAAAMPGQKTHVILPVTTMKDTEVYAPNYENGQKVVLIRHPHGGTFEIPELTVNNRQPDAKRIIAGAKDAIGIHPNVAERLSGADFDGDTVLVIPNRQHGPDRVQSSPPLKELEGFDAKKLYAPYDGMKSIDGGIYNAATRKVEYGPKGPNFGAKGQQMGDVSNLITDMTIKGAQNHEIARAVKHSMVVIDAEKHVLNYKQSAIDNGIRELKARYQNGPTSGASTLISLASSQARVGDRKLRSAKNGGPIDPKTGKLVYEYSGDSYTKEKTYKRTGETVTVEVPKTVKSTKMAETDDAHALSSGTLKEELYANHANKLKALANEARKAMVATKYIPYSQSANRTYSSEVATLNSKLNTALKNKPLERQAQLLADVNVKAKKQADPTLDPDTIKKLKDKALVDARARLGAGKKAIDITPGEWEAIQAGAISTAKLKQIIDNANLEQVKGYALPRQKTALSDANLSRARLMVENGYTKSEIAQALGVSVNTLNVSLE